VEVIINFKSKKSNSKNLWANMFR